jgi:Fur family transcriptional regulator, ferric uptake regulator
MCQKCDYSQLLQDAELAPLTNRLMVLEIVGNSPSPLSPQKIFEIFQRSRNMNKVTLYRILDLLVEKELLHRISAGDRSFRYGLAPNPNHPHHPHFYCSRCGNMECLAPEAVNVDTRSIQRTFPALIEKVEIRLDGICRRCLKTRKGESR